MNSSPVAPPQPETEKLHFLDYWQVITKRKEVIIATAVILILAVTAYSFVVRPQYTAYSQIRIEATPSVAPFLTPGSEELYRMRTSTDEAAFNTHERQLVSDRVLQAVIEGNLTKTVWRCDRCKREYSEADIHRMQDVECTREGCSGHIRRHEVRKYPTWVKLNEKWSQDDNAPETYSLQVAVIMLGRRISVRPERGTTLINIYYTSPDRNEVAPVANMIAEVYKQYQEEQSRERGSEPLSVLLEEIDLLRRGTGTKKGLDQLEKEMYAFKEKHQIVIGPNGLPIYLDLNQFRGERIRLEAQIVGLQTRLDKLEGAEREQKIASLQSQPLYDFKRMLAEQKIARSQALIEKDKNHPQVVQLTESIKELEQKINDEVAGLLNSMRIDLETLRSQKDELDKEIRSVEGNIHKQEKVLSEFTRLAQEVERLSAIYQQVAQKKAMEFFKQAIPASLITITQEATPPLEPSRPNKLLNIIIGVVVGLTVGTGLAYFIEYLDTSVKTIDDLERNLNMPILGVIPQRVKLLTETTHKSPAYEAYRMLWTNIDFARQDAKLRTVLVTSGGVGEGKTTSLVNLAIVIAREGNRVLVIDSDFRRPRVHKLLGLSNQEGLTDVLIRNADPERLALETDVPNLWVLPSGKLPPSSMGLLNSRNMRECIEHLYTKYDIILFDSPPVIGVSDASVLASLVDRIVLVVEYRKYPRSVATRAKKILENVGGRILGGVINNLNIVKEDYYYYSQVYHYFQASGEDTAAADTAQQAPPSPDEDEAPPHEDEQDDTA